jgi:putative endonuclease
VGGLPPAPFCLMAPAVGREREPCVYILASKPRGTLYTGVTSNLPGRIAQHREGAIAGFTRRYGVKRLVWFEAGDAMEAVITREKQIKEWKRLWKIQLIEEHNLYWDDLAVTIFGFPPLP